MATGIVKQDPPDYGTATIQYLLPDGGAVTALLSFQSEYVLWSRNYDAELLTRAFQDMKVAAIAHSPLEIVRGDELPFISQWQTGVVRCSNRYEGVLTNTSPAALGVYRANPKDNPWTRAIDERYPYIWGQWRATVVAAFQRFTEGARKSNLAPKVVPRRRNDR